MKMVKLTLTVIEDGKEYSTNMEMMTTDEKEVLEASVKNIEWQKQKKKSIADGWTRLNEQLIQDAIEQQEVIGDREWYEGIARLN